MEEEYKPKEVSYSTAVYGYILASYVLVSVHFKDDRFSDTLACCG